jgi:hypothetical protein
MTHVHVDHMQPIRQQGTYSYTYGKRAYGVFLREQVKPNHWKELPVRLQKNVFHDKSLIDT